ncbi:MAG TPA: hypothetical protein VFT04_14365 [Gemmatimonadales bacterium]|nr:hypothetical protein [Gemmatimonadales bacterium]
MLKATVPGSGGDPHAKLGHALTGTIGNAASADDPAIITDFHPPRVGAPARGTRRVWRIDRRKRAVRVPLMPELSRTLTIILLAIIVAGIILGLATDIGLFGFIIAAIAALVWIAMAMRARRRAV